MGTLSSRKTQELEFQTPELELEVHPGPTIKILVDRITDPPVLTITQEEVWPYPEELLLYKVLDKGFSLQDLMQVLNVLGHNVEYEERA